jgi:hypothetical protein
MQSTLDRSGIYLLLRGARRQESERRQAASRRKPAAGALPARLTGDGWWLNASEAAQPPRASAAPRLAIINESEILPAKVTAHD